MVSEPISPERFAVLVERAGLKLTPEQFEELRQAYPLVERMAEQVSGVGERGGDRVSGRLAHVEAARELRQPEAFVGMRGEEIEQGNRALGRRRWARHQDDVSATAAPNARARIS